MEPLTHEAEAARKVNMTDTRERLDQLGNRIHDHMDAIMDRAVFDKVLIVLESLNTRLDAIEKRLDMND